MFRWVLLLIGVHSIALGLFIYFCTDFFYHLFFATRVENAFFVRQSGIFLFLAGLFYLFPLLNLKRYHLLIGMVFISKVVAVYFLLANARYTPAPKMIYLATAGDASMALALLVLFVRNTAEILRGADKESPAESIEAES
jgi:hypothetical protein